MIDSFPLLAQIPEPWRLPLLLITVALMTALFVWFALRGQSQRRLLQREAELQNDIVRLETTLEAERRSADEKLSLLAEAREQLKLQFQQLASEILEDKTKRFTEMNQEKLGALLLPLNERIAGFQKQVAEAYDKETRDRRDLFHQIESLQKLNQTVTEETRNLTTALKGQSKTQGNWGEMILEKVLEQSGLEKGREYETQLSFSTTEGRRLPDAIVHLPDNRDIIIDAKVALTAYERYCSAEDDSERDIQLKAHVASLQTHLRQLSAKDYQDLEGINTLDFVLMFVPIEAALVEALRASPDLQNEALKRNIALCSPFTLLPALRTVENIWKFDKQTKNAQEIARQAGGMYDKLVGFVDDLEKVEKALDQSQKAIGSARNKLESGNGNLIGRAEKIRKLGASANKLLPATDDDQ